MAFEMIAVIVTGTVLMTFMKAAGGVYSGVAYDIGHRDGLACISHD